MNTNTEIIRQKEIELAWARGGKLEMATKDRNDWEPVTDRKPRFYWEQLDYRIATPQRTRPLRRDDWHGLPVIWVRHIDGRECMVDEMSDDGFFSGRNAHYRIEWQNTPKGSEWSTDRIHWKPFEVEA